MGGSERLRDTALIVKPLMVPEQGKFLPAHLGRDRLPGRLLRNGEDLGAGMYVWQVAMKFSSPFSSPGL